MVVAGVTYAQYIAQLLYPNTYLLYVSAVIIGLGAPVIWTAQVQRHNLLKGRFVGECLN